MTDATAAAWEAWLRPIAAAVRNTPAPSDVKGRAAALAFTMRGVRATALTPDKARDVIRKAEFFPSVAEIEAVFAAEWKEAARSRAIGGNGLARLAPPTPIAETPITERRAIAARAMAVAAELKAGATAARPEGVKALPLPPQVLLAQHEAEAAKGNAASAMRAAAIRAALGIEA
jgi:hypothetical protein